MAPLPSLALELIFEQLVHDAPTLADCALVSRGWADPAQRALFGRRTFHIGRTADQLAYDRPACVSKFCVEAFTDMLAAAPHLAGHVRRLFFDMGDATKRAGPTVTVAEITRPLVEWRLTNLVSLELSGYASCRIVPMTGIDEALAAGLPMLTHLRIHETRLRSFSTLQCLVCSLPSLQSLSLSRIHWNSDMPGPSTPVRGLDALRLLEFELGHLIREDGDEYTRMHEQLFAWLLHTPSTRSLRKITLDTDCRCQGEKELVRTVGIHAHGLHLHLKNYDSIGAFHDANVVKLTLSIPHKWSLLRICNYLAGFGTPTMVVLHLQFESAGNDKFVTIHMYNWSWKTDGGDWTEPRFDESGFPALQRLELSFPPQVEHVCSGNLLRSAFHGLNARNAIHFDPRVEQYEPMEDDDSDDECTWAPGSLFD